MDRSRCLVLGGDALADVPLLEPLLLVGQAADLVDDLLIVHELAPLTSGAFRPDTPMRPRCSGGG